MLILNMGFLVLDGLDLALSVWNGVSFDLDELGLMGG